MSLKKNPYLCLLVLVLLWLMPFNIANAADVVGGPHDLLAEDYTVVLDSLLFEDGVTVDLPAEDRGAGEEALASAPDPEPMSFLQVVDKIKSFRFNEKGEIDNKVEEPVGTLDRLSKSMWYNDGNLAYQNITVWDG